MFSRIAVGIGQICALTAAGAAYCRVDNYAGSLGDGFGDHRLLPVRVPFP